MYVCMYAVPAVGGVIQHSNQLALQLCFVAGLWQVFVAMAGVCGYDRSLHAVGACLGCVSRPCNDSVTGKMAQGCPASAAWVEYVWKEGLFGPYVRLSQA